MNPEKKDELYVKGWNQGYMIGICVGVAGFLLGGVLLDVITTVFF